MCPFCSIFKKCVATAAGKHVTLNNLMFASERLPVNVCLICAVGQNRKTTNYNLKSPIRVNYIIHVEKDMAELERNFDQIFVSFILSPQKQYEIKRSPVCLINA